MRCLAEMAFNKSHKLLAWFPRGYFIAINIFPGGGKGKGTGAAVLSAPPSAATHVNGV